MSLCDASLMSHVIVDQSNHNNDNNFSSFSSSLSLKVNSSTPHASINKYSYYSLSRHAMQRLQMLLKEYEDVFPQDLPPGLPHDRGVTHNI